MLAVAPPALHRQDSTSRASVHVPSSSTVSSRARQSTTTTHQQRWPLTHSRSHPPDAQRVQHPTTPVSVRQSASTSTPQLAAVSEPPAVEPASKTEPQSAQPGVIPDQPPRPAFDIHAVPAPELLKLLASLLQQIASANDALCASSPAPSAPRSPSSQHSAAHSPIWQTLTSASRIAFSTSTAPLSFHARNIPTISLEAYLLRILKYCPISNEVFLALLVYFDRMSKLASETTGQVFAIDSYNVHRLVIAGVTVASKFLSDVFYTNTRYAKVGGLPQTELNQLELQFLLLNDFRLLISREEMQKYAEQLMVYARSRGQMPAAAEACLSPAPSGSSPQPEESRAVATEGETTDGETGETTDDEPTIRPDHSCASSETQSILTAGEDTDAESHDEHEFFA